MIRVLVGLGNPGSRYRSTRHNIGFRVVEEVGERLGADPEREAAHCLVGRASVDGREVVLARPTLFMNRSGPAVKALLKREGAEPDELLVVCDDLNLDFGTLRLRPQGSHGGQNGLRSIIETLGTQAFPRLRVGVGPAPEGTEHADFVLARFGPEARGRLSEVVGRAADCVEISVRDGLGQAMNRCNRRAGADAPAADAQDG